jgi:hypothetical protein
MPLKEKNLMKTHGKTVVRILLVGLVATMAMTAFSFAQSTPVQSGSFTLPFAAQWGGLSLNAGTYSFAIRRGGINYTVEVGQGDRELGFILPTGFSSPGDSKLDEAALLCVRHSGSCSIGALKIPQFGVLYFNAPQSKSIVAQQPNLIERLPVLLAKK